MWPFGDVYIENRIEAPSAPSNHQELAELATQTKNLAIANQNVADALNQDRITISNFRYAELTNKSRLLNVLIKYVNDYFSLIGNLKTSSVFKEFYKDPYRYIDAMNNYNIYCKITDDIYINIRSKDNKLRILKSEKPFIFDNPETPFVFDYPEYIPYEEGNTVLIGDKYKKLLKEELLLKEYIKIVENLESLSFYFFGDFRKSDMIHFLMRDVNLNEYNMQTVFYFDENFKISKKQNKYRLSSQTFRYVNVEFKINI